MANFDLTALALAGCCPGNEVIYDDKGMPSIMVKIPKMTYAQLGMGSSNDVFPAFKVGNRELDAIYISKFINMVQNNRAYSLPGFGPAHTLNFDTARTYCSNKGAGWHLITRMEWGLLVRWCQNNGFMPLGNNNYGKHSSESVYKAIPDNTDATHYALRTKVGTGPLTWYHDKSPSGIADLCGNVWEWSGGMRMVYGELQILPNNNGADNTVSQAADSAEWKAIKASDGTLITPDGSGTTSGSIKADWISSKLTWSDTKTNNTGSGSSLYSSCTFANIVCDSSISAAAKLLLASLGMYMYNGTTELFSGQYGYFDNQSAERCFFSGGGYYYTGYGLASFNGFNARSGADNVIGFRSAYYPPLAS